MSVARRREIPEGLDVTPTRRKKRQVAPNRFPIWYPRKLPPTVDVLDHTANFLAFYELGRREGPDPEARWALWEEVYNFAGVPPTPARREMARGLLDAAWDRYPGAMPQIEAGAASRKPDPLDAFRSVAARLKHEDPIHMQMIAFVGGFEGIPFVFAVDGLTTLTLQSNRSWSSTPSTFPTS